MRQRLLISLSALALIAAACSGDGEGPGAPFHDLSGLPDNFPVYEGSSFSNGDDDKAGGFLGVWETGDDAAAVQRYFDGEFQDGPWRIVDETEEGGSIVIRVEREGEVGVGEPNAGIIVIRDDGEVTRIVKDIGIKDGDKTRTPRPDATERPATTDPSDPDATPETFEGGLPPGYPSTLAPLTSDATVTTSSLDSSGTLAIYLVHFTTASSPDALVPYYQAALTAQGWTVNLIEVDPDSGSFLLNYVGSGGESVHVAGSGSDSGSDVDVTVTVAQ